MGGMHQVGVDLRGGILTTVIVEFAAEVWLWDARRMDTWTFVSLPPEESERIRDATGGVRRGFGSVRVRATVGHTTWTTSIFPDGERGTFVLPIKKAVRTAQRLDVGDTPRVTLEVLDV
jgi:Domain of unknown function (DUF1905)